MLASGRSARRPAYQALGPPVSIPELLIMQHGGPSISAARWAGVSTGWIVLPKKMRPRSRTCLASKGRDQDVAARDAFGHRQRQALFLRLAVRMQARAVGAFQHQQIGVAQGREGRAEH